MCDTNELVAKATRDALWYFVEDTPIPKKCDFCKYCIFTGTGKECERFIISKKYPTTDNCVEGIIAQYLHDLLEEQNGEGE